MDDILDTLIRIQHCDANITAMQSEVNAIPGKIERIENEISKAAASLQEKRQRLGAIRANYKMREGDIAANEAKVVKLNSQTFAVKTNDEYRALLSEIEYLKQENSRTEEIMISMLEEEELLNNSIRELDVDTRDFTDQRKRDIAGLNQRRQELDEKISVVRSDYDNAFVKLPKDVQDMYNRIKAVRGKAVSLVSNETCTGCFSNITPQFLNELKQKDRILRCDNCGRILIYVSSQSP